MPGFRRRNEQTQGVLLWTLVLDDEVVDKEYLLKKLDERGIKFVRSKVDEESPEDVDVQKWLNKTWGDVEKNYIWLIYWLTIFCNFRWPDRHEKSYEKYVDIPSEFFRAHIPHRLLPIIRNILEAAQVIKINHSYLTKKAAKKVRKKAHPKSFRIYSEGEFKNRKINTTSLPALDTILVFHNDDWLKAKPESPINDDLKTYEVIKTNLSKVRLVSDAVDIVQAADYDSKGSRHFHLRTIEMVNSFAAPELTPKQVEHWNIKANYHEHTGRVYTSLSNFPRRWRHLLRIKGFPLWNIDATACHPFLLINLYDQSNAAPALIDRERKRYKKRFSHNSDFYLTIGEMGGIERKSKDQTNEEYRSMIKDEVMTFMNATWKDQQKTKLFQAYKKNKFYILLEAMERVKTSLVVDRDSILFKKLQEAVEDRNSKHPDKRHSIKDVYYIQMSQLTSLWEGEMMIKTVCRRLAHEGVVLDGKHYQPWFIPFHDAIWTQRHFVKPIKKLLKEVWKEHCGATPPFKATNMGETKKE